MSRRPTRTDSSRDARPSTRPVPQKRSRRVPLVAAGGVALAFGLGLFSGSSLHASERVAAQGSSQQRGARHTPAAAPRLTPSTRDPSEKQVRPAAFEPLEAASAQPTVAHDHDPNGCQHGPGDLADAETFARLEQEARTLVEEGPEATLAALRGANADLYTWIAGALVEAPDLLCDPELVAGLSAIASDPALREGQRVLAMELLGRSYGTDEAALTSLGDLAQAEGLDLGLRAVAVSSLRLLSREREDLRAAVRSALLVSAERAPAPWLRADALDAVRAQGASPEQVASLVRHLDDADAEVRSAAARALGESDAARRGGVLEALERSLLRETNPEAGAIMLASALRVARADAVAALARLAEAPLVEATPALRQQAADYRRLLTQGETDPTRILRAQEALVHSRTAQLTQ